MDARQIRTRITLARTIRDLASERSLDAISVTDVATRAGISRPTFYAHADSPGALLGSVLAEELALPLAPTETQPEPRPETPAEQLTEFLASVAEHVQRNHEIYHNNVRLRLPPRLRDVLLEHLEHGFSAHLAAHPHIAPKIDETVASGPDDVATTAVDVAPAPPRDHQVFAAMAASATVAALENWLRSPDAAQPDQIVEIILTGIAEWWSA